MRHILFKSFVINLVFFLSFSFADEQADGKKYGSGISLKDTTNISDIMADPEKWVGKKVLVKGQIVDVCKKRGCWMELASDKEFQTIRIKVNDGEIVFPLQARGKTALAEGTVEKLELSLEQTINYYKHHAEEQGQEFDESSVKAPMKIYRIRGLGASIQ